MSSAAERERAALEAVVAAYRLALKTEARAPTYLMAACALAEAALAAPLSPAPDYLLRPPLSDFGRPEHDLDVFGRRLRPGS